jgi:AcrR family transcriptional regulator
VVAKPVGAGDRTRAAILEAVADLVAQRGSEVSMSDFAEAAGVGRATLYRYFPTRESLIGALFRAALAEARSRLEAASLADVPFEEGVARAARALVTVGSRYLVLVREQPHVKTVAGCEEETLHVRELLHTLMLRGLESGAVRAGVPVAWLENAFGALILAALEFAAEEGNGVEDTAALVATQFLAGVRP